MWGVGCVCMYVFMWECIEDLTSGQRRERKRRRRKSGGRIFSPWQAKNMFLLLCKDSSMKSNSEVSNQIRLSTPHNRSLLFRSTRLTRSFLVSDAVNRRSCQLIHLLACLLYLKAAVRPHPTTQLFNHYHAEQRGVIFAYKRTSENER